MAVLLQLAVDPAALTEDSFDVCVRFGEPPDARVHARLLAPNRRLLCASPAYLSRRATPMTPQDLVLHDWIGIRHGDDAYGVWLLQRGPHEAGVKVHGPLGTNDGDVAVRWAIEGHGIVLRSKWDVFVHLRSGRLVPLLEGYDTPLADIYAVYPHRHQSAARVRAFVDLLAEGSRSGAAA